MILVTVGSTNHDDLVRAVDELVKEKKIKEKVVCQIGQGKYLPKYCKYFGFDPEIDKNYYQKCKIIISTDSAGTIFRNLELGNKIIAVRHLVSKGAKDLGFKLSKLQYIEFIDNYLSISNLKEKILLDYNLVKSGKLKKYNPKKFNKDILLSYILKVI